MEKANLKITMSAKSIMMCLEDDGFEVSLDRIKRLKKNFSVMKTDQRKLRRLNIRRGKINPKDEKAKKDGKTVIGMSGFTRSERCESF
jgi:hypothetical protein